jgi:hypothetical protein
MREGFVEEARELLDMDRAFTADERGVVREVAA